MSQRTKKIDELINIDIKINVTLKSLSNHNGFTNEQIDLAKKEFKEKIKSQLVDKLSYEYYLEDFLNSVDFVSYEVSLDEIQNK